MRSGQLEPLIDFEIFNSNRKIIHINKSGIGKGSRLPESKISPFEFI